MSNRPKINKRKPTHPTPLTLRDMPFTQLVASEPTLREARQKYMGASPRDRRRAAEWGYDAGIADDLFSHAMRCAGDGSDFNSKLEAGVSALAIDPLYAPALLTVGSLEYQYQRREAAMEMFMTLTTLSETESELAKIIDEAGCFLLDNDDATNAARLYRAASQSYPETGEHWSNLSYCLVQLGEMEEAVVAAHKALALKADDPYMLNDLGWTLVLAEQYDEARTVLERAAALAPKDYEFPKNNLAELEKRQRHNKRSAGLP